MSERIQSNEQETLDNHLAQSYFLEIQDLKKVIQQNSKQSVLDAHLSQSYILELHESKKLIERLLGEQNLWVMTDEKKKKYDYIVTRIEKRLGKLLPNYSVEDDDFEDYIK